MTIISCLIRDIVVIKMQKIHQNHMNVGHLTRNKALKNFDKSASRRYNRTSLHMEKVREPQMVIIRNKFTREIVDLEVGLDIH